MKPRKKIKPVIFLNAAEEMAKHHNYACHAVGDASREGHKRFGREYFSPEYWLFRRMFNPDNGLVIWWGEKFPELKENQQCRVLALLLAHQFCLDKDNINYITNEINDIYESKKRLAQALAPK